MHSQTTSLIGSDPSGSRTSPPLRRLHGAPDGQLVAFAGDDAIETLTATVLDLADNLGIELDERTNQI